MSLISFLIIGLLAGWIASHLMEGKGYGLLGDIIIGIVGAFIGGYIFQWLGVTFGGFFGNIAISAIGAIIFLFIVNLIKKKD